MDHGLSWGVVGYRTDDSGDTRGALSFEPDSSNEAVRVKYLPSQKSTIGQKMIKCRPYAIQVIHMVHGSYRWFMDNRMIYLYK